MTPTEKAKRAEALYYDNHNITRRTLCHRIANLEADLEDARAENAKLREELESVGTAAYLYGCSDLKDENTEQAISNDCTNSEQTDTCQNVAPWYLDFLCSKCGFVHYHSDENDTDDRNEWHFCPNCGRRVEVDE